MADDDKKAAETEAEEGEGEEGEEGAGGGKGAKKLIILIALGAILVGGAVAGGVFFFIGGDEPAATEAEPALDPAAQLTDVAFFDMPQVSVNLMADSAGQVGRFLKIKVSLELESEVDVETIKTLLPRLQDDFQTFLRQLRLEDIKGSAGMHRLREGLLLRAQQSAAPARVRNVLFKEITIQ